MATVQLSDGFFSQIVGDVKSAGQSVIDKTVGRAKSAVNQQVDKYLPQTRSTTPPIVQEQPYIPSETNEEGDGKSYTMYYIAGAAVLAFIIYKVAK